MLHLPHIAFEITDRCNLDCVFCYNIWKIDGYKHTAFNSYQKAIDTLKELFKQAEVSSIALTGGEPLLAERMSEVALFCRMEGKAVTIISNGTQGKENDYKQLINMGVGLFEFPVHSAQAAVHDQMAQVKGSWTKSVNSIKSVLNLGGQVIPVVVITLHNVNLLGETIDFIQSLGCNRIMLNRYNIGGKGCNNPMEISATAEELRKAFDIANRKAIDLNLSLTSNVCSPICLLNPTDYPKIGFGHCSFDPLSRPITININGNVRLCNHSPIVAGNIFEKNIADILFSDYSQSWEKTIPTYCTNCKAWNICKGGCRAASEQCGLNLEKEDPIVSYISQKYM